MRNIEVTTVVSVSATIEFSEGELRALDAMTYYGINPFLKVFYEKLGTAYMRPYDADLRALFKRIDSTVPEALKKVKAARKVIGCAQ
jgi:hypothetical protein